MKVLNLVSVFSAIPCFWDSFKNSIYLHSSIGLRNASVPKSIYDIKSMHFLHSHNGRKSFTWLFLLVYSVLFWKCKGVIWLHAILLTLMEHALFQDRLCLLACTPVNIPSVFPWCSSVYYSNQEPFILPLAVLRNANIQI